MTPQALGIPVYVNPDAGFVGIAVMIVVALAVAGGMWAGATFVGPKVRNYLKQQPFECGNPSEGLGARRFAVKYHLVAILFLVFDLEVVFLYPWAVHLSKMTNETGWYALVVVIPFLTLLVAGLVYEYAKGALEWE